MKRTLLGIGMVLIAAQIACGSDSATYVAPAVDGQSGSSDQSELQALLDDNFAADGPAVVVLVDGPEGRFVAARGMKDIYAGTPADSGGRFRIASISKTFLAATILDLVDDGLLSLDNTMTDLLPRDITDHIAYSDRITVRQMMNMTSGVFSYSDTDAFWDESDADPLWYLWTPEDAISYAYDHDPYFAPGEGYQYSNSNYMLLHLVVERITGQPLAQVIDERVAAPLGLQNTYSEGYKTPDGGIVHCYDGDILGWEDMTEDYNSLGWGDAGMISSADDLATFIRALAQGRVLSPARLADMTTYVETGDGQYGLGLERYIIDGEEVVGHSGKASGFVSEMWYLPDYDTAVIVLIASEDYSDDSQDLAEEAATIVLDD